MTKLLQVCLDEKLKIDADNVFYGTIAAKQNTKMSRADMFGCMRGQFEITDDFDAPLDDFMEYME